MLIKQVIGQILWIVLMGLILGWLARSRETRSGQAGGRMRIPRSFLIVGWVCFGFFAGLALLSTVFLNEPGAVWVPYFFLGFSLLGVPVIAGYYRYWIQLEADGVTCGRWFGGPRAVRWLDITQVKYSETLREFHLKASDGRIVRVSGILGGFPEFAEAVLREVHESCMDQATRRVLHRTAQGNLPPVWM